MVVGFRANCVDNFHTYRSLLDFRYRLLLLDIFSEDRRYGEYLGASLPIRAVEVTPTDGTHRTEYCVLVQVTDTVWTTDRGEQELVKAMLGLVVVGQLAVVEQVTHRYNIRKRETV